MKRLPSPRCARCDQPLEAIGGRRLTATPVAGATIVTLNTPIRDLPDSAAHVLRLEDRYRDLALVLWGSWGPEAIARAVEDAQAGLRPWMCQLCTGRTCPACGSPIRFPLHADLLEDDGESVHSPHIPCNAVCTNPGCDQFRA